MISSQILKVDKDHSVGLLVRNLTVTVSSKRSNNVKILDDVSFKLEHGLFMAIMGGSGSGKTTLLNTLSQRLNYTNKNLKFSGEILYFSGKPTIG